ncbi:hypothetical protein T484DRAFT_1965494 [Baffinella frigidus]|nr:hypothetical protein T484DRAFT_1965494 [Cryptophyta sp. CCMP2293]
MSGTNKAAMKRIGYFGEEGYATIGDMYHTKVKETMPRYKGAQFTTNPRIKNKHGLENGAFGKKICVYVGCLYETLDQVQRRDKMKEKAFMTPAFPLGGRIPYIPQGPGKGSTKKGDVVSEFRNIITAPNPKGGFGYTNMTMGVPQAAGMRRAWKGVAGEYAYLPDAYDAARQAERAYLKADCGGTISAFFPYIPTSNNIKKTRAYVQENTWKDPYDRDAFKPNNPGKKGGPGFWGVGKKGGGGSATINGFPVALPDPYDTLRYDTLKERRDKKANLGTLADRQAFNPTSFGRSKCTPSVFTMNIRV